MFRKLLDKYPFIVLDGAFGTEITNRGFDTNDELWSAKALFEQPELVKSVHYDYYKAGADVSTSASYQASVEGFEKKGFSREEAKELIKKAIYLTREARDEFWQANASPLRPRPLVAGSVGPYGAYLADGSEYRGDYTVSKNELRDFHAERLSLIVEAQPDVLACETLPLIDEAVVIAAELKRYPEMAAWFSFSCKDGKHISSGEPIQDAVRALRNNPQVVAIGLNCTAPEYVEDLIKAIKEKTSKPVVIYPNTGEKYEALTKTWKGSPTPYRDYARIWYEAGANLIGGCCRTTPKTIEGLAAFRQSLKK